MVFLAQEYDTARRHTGGDLVSYEYWTVRCLTIDKVILLHCQTDKGGNYTEIEAPPAFNVACQHCGKTHRYEREEIKSLVSENPPPEGFVNLL
jgi:hypothetical protein